MNKLMSFAATHVTNGTEAGKLDALAPAVDFVRSEALKSLARPRDE